MCVKMNSLFDRKLGSVMLHKC